MKNFSQRRKLRSNERESKESTVLYYTGKINCEANSMRENKR